MADYSDPDEPLGGWASHYANIRREQAARDRRARIDALMEKVIFRLADGGVEYCDYCGAVVAPFYTGAHTSHKAWHLFVLETTF